jgi:hypothetical protein
MGGRGVSPVAAGGAGRNRSGIRSRAEKTLSSWSAGGGGWGAAISSGGLALGGSGTTVAVASGWIAPPLGCAIAKMPLCSITFERAGG